MPGMTGLEAIEEIMSARPTPILVLVVPRRPGSEQRRRRGTRRRGARRDPQGGHPRERSRRRGRSRLSPPRQAARRRARDPSSTRSTERPDESPAATRRPRPRLRDRDLRVDRRSPRARRRPLGSRGLPVPVLVVQHIAWASPRPRALARRQPCTVRGRRRGWRARRVPACWFAPDDAHLTLEPGALLALDTGPSPARTGRPPTCCWRASRARSGAARSASC